MTQSLPQKHKNLLKKFAEADSNRALKLREIINLETDALYLVKLALELIAEMQTEIDSLKKDNNLK